MVLSGFAMIVIGGWLSAQAIGGNLAGRIRSWANRQIGTPTAAAEPERESGGGTRTGRMSGGGARG